MKLGIYSIRFIHLLITIYFVACVSYVYYCLLINIENKILYIAIISLLIEGLIVFLNKSECPLVIAHRKFGDAMSFFELFLPKQLAKKAIPYFAILSITGLVLFFLRKIFL